MKKQNRSKGIKHDPRLETLIALFQKYKPLIRKGYRVLKKEVTLGMPAPCMPPIDRDHDTGIGSAFGAGAERVVSFFGGVFDKILLGPMGPTVSASGHSPYISDWGYNPFLLPLEKMVTDGLFSEKELNRIYAIPKKDGVIDFKTVEKSYRTALAKAYSAAGKGKSFPDFISSVAARYYAKAPADYIGDLQVQIPPHAPGLKSSMLLKGYSLGCPPDQFSDKPQVWNFRIFDPAQVFDGHGNLGPAGRVWYNIIDSAMKQAKGGLRIDHYIGFVNPYVISDKDPKDAVRLFSSPNHPLLGKYVKKDFSDITRQIVLACAQNNGLKSTDIYPEDIGTRPPQLDQVFRRCGLGRLLVAQFFEPTNWDHIYHLSQAKPLDIATLDTHDTPSVQQFFDNLSPEKRAQFAWTLSADLRFNYNDDLCRTEQLIRMQWGALLASPARRIQAFFTSWTGQGGRYNIPEKKNQWRLRCVSNFEELYFKNLAKGRAYNPFDAISLAIYARGDDFYHKNEQLVHALRAAEDEILSLSRSLLG